MALTRAKKGARFVMCGAISQYNATTPYGIKVSGRPCECNALYMLTTYDSEEYWPSDGAAHPHARLHRL